MSTGLIFNDSANAVALRYQEAGLVKTSIDDMVAHVCKGIKAAKPRDALDYYDEQHHRKARRQIKVAANGLNAVMSNYPRTNGESLDDYIQRVFTGAGGVQYDNARVVRWVVTANAELMWWDEFKESEEKRERDAIEAQRKAERAQLENRASPDLDQIKRLHGIIEDAKEGEAFLAKIAEAIALPWSPMVRRAQRRSRMARQRHPKGLSLTAASTAEQ